MLSQGHMVAPVYHYNGQIGPRFRDSGSLEEWKLCHSVIVGADIHIRPLHTSILYIQSELAIGMLSQGHRVHPYSYTGKLPPRVGDSGSLEEWT